MKRNEASSWLYTVGISQHLEGAGSLNAVSVRGAGRRAVSLGTDKYAMVVLWSEASLGFFCFPGHL